MVQNDMIWLLETLVFTDDLALRAEIADLKIFMWNMFGKRFVAVVVLCHFRNPAPRKKDTTLTTVEFERCVV